MVLSAVTVPKMRSKRILEISAHNNYFLMDFVDCSTMGCNNPIQKMGACALYPRNFNGYSQMLIDLMRVPELT